VPARRALQPHHKRSFCVAPLDFFTPALL